MKVNDSNYYNCYNYCSYNYYFDRNINKSFCTRSQKCSEPYNKKIFEKNECIDDCNNHPIYKNEFNNICFNETQNNLITTDIINSELIDIINKTELINEMNKTKLINEINESELANEKNNKTEIINILKDNLI